MQETTDKQIKLKTESLIYSSDDSVTRLDF